MNSQLFNTTPTPNKANRNYTKPGKDIRELIIRWVKDHLAGQVDEEYGHWWSTGEVLRDKYVHGGQRCVFDLDFLQDFIYEISKKLVLDELSVIYDMDMDIFKAQCCQELASKLRFFDHRTEGVLFLPGRNLLNVVIQNDTNEQKEPIHEAKQSAIRKLVRILIKHGASPNKPEIGVQLPLVHVINSSTDYHSDYVERCILFRAIIHILLGKMDHHVIHQYMDEINVAVYNCQRKNESFLTAQINAHDMNCDILHKNDHCHSVMMTLSNYELLIMKGQMHWFKKYVSKYNVLTP